MADSLSTLGLEAFADLLKKKKSVVGVSIGAHGVNNVFNAVAQEGPELTLFLNEQMRQYDKDFYKFASRFTNVDQVFGTATPLSENMELQFISRMNTILHEDSHVPFPVDGTEYKRFGNGKEATLINEIKANILYPALIPSILEKGGLEGTREQWALGMMASAMQSLNDEADDSEYFINATYALNDVFQKGIVVQNGESFTINDFDAYYKTVKDAAQELVDLHKDPTMTPEKAKQWIDKRCKPNEKLQQAIAVLKAEKED